MYVECDSLTCPDLKIKHLLSYILIKQHPSSKKATSSNEFEKERIRKCLKIYCRVYINRIKHFGEQQCIKLTWHCLKRKYKLMVRRYMFNDVHILSITPINFQGQGSMVETGSNRNTLWAL